MFIGRKEEQQMLLSLLEQEESQFVVVYGRRRVGKTYLVRETFHYQFAFQHTGVSNGSYRKQLSAFRDSLKSCGLEKCNIPNNWSEAFNMLEQLLEQAKPGKKVIFIDELPWMDTPKSDIISAIEHFWNSWATSRVQKDIVLIVCGSATSWITRNLLKNKGGLRGRLTGKLLINPFNLHECEEYCKAKQLVLSRKDITEMYMILGGIPYYWSFLDRGKSVPQLVDSLFFQENAQLKDEFEALYSTLFKRPEKYIDVIKVLCGKKSGLTRTEILNETHLKNGGSFSEILENLEQCGFIRHYQSFNKEERDILYQLIDNYTLFYFNCINKNAFSDEQYWQHSYLSVEHSTWAGLSFERVCLQHIDQIKKALGIYGILTNVCSWKTVKNEWHEGAQIDLLIVRGDNVMNICEMKFSKSLYAINKDDAENWERKMRVIRQVVGSNYTYHLTLVTTEGIEQNTYRNLPQSVLTLDDLF